MTQEPLVSIVIPTYNRATLIGETIQSVLDQTYSNWELIIVDDGSIDNTKQVIDSFKNNKITYLSIPHCGLLGKLRNVGIRKSSGDLIAFLDSDDLWKKEKLAVQVTYLKQYPEAFFIINNGELFGNSAFKSPPDYDDFYFGKMLLHLLSESRFLYYTGALLFRREVIKKIGLLNEDLTHAPDPRFFLTMCNHYEGIFINARLVKIRKHQANTSSDTSANVYRDSIETLQLLFRDGSLTRKQYHTFLRRYYYKMGVLQLQNKTYQSSSVTFLHYIKITPLHWKGYIRLMQALVYSLR